MKWKIGINNRITNLVVKRSFFRYYPVETSERKIGTYAFPKYTKGNARMLPVVCTVVPQQYDSRIHMEIFHNPIPRIIGDILFLSEKEKPYIYIILSRGYWLNISRTPCSRQSIYYSYFRRTQILISIRSILDLSRLRRHRQHNKRVSMSHRSCKLDFIGIPRVHIRQHLWRCIFGVIPEHSKRWLFNFPI